MVPWCMEMYATVVYHGVYGWRTSMYRCVRGNVLRCIRVYCDVTLRMEVNWGCMEMYEGVSRCILGFRVILNPKIHHDTPSSWNSRIHHATPSYTALRGDVLRCTSVYCNVSGCIDMYAMKCTRVYTDVVWACTYVYGGNVLRCISVYCNVSGCVRVS
jgi:hypothetical protein